MSGAHAHYIGEIGPDTLSDPLFIAPCIFIVASIFAAIYMLDVLGRRWEQQ